MPGASGSWDYPPEPDNVQSQPPPNFTPYRPQQPDQSEPPPGFTPYRPTMESSPPPGFTPYRPSESPPPEFTPYTPGPPPGFTPYRPQTAAPAPAEAESPLGTFAREAAGAVPATLGGLSGGAIAAGVGGTLGRLAGGAAGTFLGPAGTVSGWIGGGLAGGYLGEKIYAGAKNLFGFDDAQQLAVNRAAHPIASAAGQVAPLALGLSPGRGAQVAGRLLSGGLGGAIEGGTQLVQGEFSPERLAANVAAGVALPGARGWLQNLEARGAAAAGRVPHGTPGAEASAGTSQDPKPTAVPAATEFAGVRAPRPGPENYGKQSAPAVGESTGTNIGAVDPTLAHALIATADQPITAREAIAHRGPNQNVGDVLQQQRAAAAARPEDVLRGPLPETPVRIRRGVDEQGAPVWQAARGNAVVAEQPTLRALQQQLRAAPAPALPGGRGPVPPSPPGAPPPPGRLPPAGAAPSPPQPPSAGSLAAAHAAISARIAPPPSWLSRMPTSWAGIKNTAHDLYTAAKNDLHPLERLSKQGPALAPEENFSMLARLTRGLPGRVMQQLEHGTYDIKTGTVNGKPLTDVLKSVANDDRFVNYALAKHAIELEGRGVQTGMPLPEANHIVAAEAPRYEPIFRELVSFQNRVLDNLQKSGVLSADAVARMRAVNNAYVPYYRLLDPNSALGRQLGVGLKVHDPVHGIKGSAREVINPIDSIVKNTYSFTDLAHRNLALQALEDWALKHDPNGKFMRRVQDTHPVHVSPAETNRFLQARGIPASVSDAMVVFRPNAFRPADNQIRIFRDGKARVYEVDKSVADAVNAMDRESFGLLTRILKQPASLLRAGAVLSPEFIARNPVRDQFSALIQSKHGYIPVYDMLRGMGDLFKKGDMFQNWLIHGGANATLVGLDRKAIGMNPKSYVDQVKNVITSPIEALRVASEFMENATRLGEFRRGIEKGVSPTAAAYSSREVTLDFARVGAKAKGFNAVTPFFNAQLEGIDRAARAFKDNFPGTLMKVGASITLPSVLLWFANKDDPRFKELPQWEKDLFWIIPTDHWTNIKPEDAEGIGAAHKRQLPDGTWQRNDGTIWRIPKPFELGVLFGSIPERALDAYYAKSPHAFKDLHSTVMKALLPNYIPQAFVPALEQFGNRSLFLDRNMVPKHLENLPPKLQVLPQTSDTAKTLGDIVSGFNSKTSFASPIVIDNYIRGYSGGLGAYIVGAMDKMFEPKDAAQKPTWTAADTPVLKAFAARFPSAGAESIQDFYDTYAERSQAKMAAGYLQKRGRMDEAREIRENNAIAVAGGIHNQIALQHKRIRDTYESKKLTPAEKREIIDVTYLRMIDSARRGLNVFEQTKIPARQQP